MPFTRIALAVVLVLATACGRAPFARGAGSNCPDGAPEHNQSLSDLVGLPRWAEVSEVTEGKGGYRGPLRPARLSVERPLRGTWPSTADVGIDDGAVDEARAERSGKARLLAVGGAGDTAALVSLRPNGEVHFVGTCADEMFRPDVERFRRARAAVGDMRSEADLVLDAIRHPDGEAAKTLADLARPRARGVTSWGDQPADRRSLSSAPADVIATLAERSLVFRLPQSWQSVEAQLCPFAPDVGWSVCTIPQAAKGEIVVQAYVKRGSPLEIWVADRVHGFRGERRLALTISPEAWTAADHITIYGSAEVRSRDDAFRLAGRALRTQ